MQEHPENQLLFNKLPAAIMKYIFSFLPIESPFTVITAISFFKTTLEEDALWKKYYQNCFPETELLDKETKGILTWRQAFRVAFMERYKKLPKKEKSIFRDFFVPVLNGNFVDLKQKITDSSLKILEEEVGDVSFISMLTKHNCQFLLSHCYEIIKATNSTFDPKKTDEQGRTLLHWASCLNQPSAVIIALIEKGFDIHAVCNLGCTPLFYAAKYGNIEVFKVLYEQGRNIDVARPTDDVTSFYMAVQNNHLDVAMYIVEKGGDVNKPAIENEKGDTTTPLYMAVHNGHLTMVNYLLTIPRINKDAEQFQGETLMTIAVTKGHVSIVKRLLLDEVDAPRMINTAEKGTARTPLHLAITYENRDMVDILLSNKHIDLGPRNGKNYTAFEVALGNNLVEIVACFLEKHPDLLEKDVLSEGMTPLLMAVGFGNVEMARFLLMEKYANPNAVAKNNWSIRGLLVHPQLRNLDKMKLLFEEYSASLIKPIKLQKCS